MASVINQLRGLVLSAAELRDITNWPPALIEDYLNILDNIITLAENLDIEIAQKIEEVPTDFTDGSVPYAKDGFLTQDNDDFNFDDTLKQLLVGGGIKGPNRAKQYFFAGF
jgi:hypothetical protein